MLGPLLAGPAWALPSAPETFCDVYPDTPLCSAGTVSCSQCHDLTGPPLRNPYGDDVARAWQVDDALERALVAVELLDSDIDGARNVDEISAGSPAGIPDELTTACDAQQGGDNPFYDVGAWDPRFALRRVTLDVCGRSPFYEEMVALADADDPRAMVHAQLDACLGSRHWADVLDEMSLPVVEPRFDVPDCASPLQGDDGPVDSEPYTLGNPAWERRLFRYVMSGDRDARDVLRAKYLVVEEPVGSGQLVAVDEPRDGCELEAQPVDREHRFGLMTMRASMVTRTRYRELPRVIAAVIYRELLGYDLRHAEGLYPVDELDGALPWPAPADPEGRGVTAEECAACHSTLDPAATPWARYNYRNRAPGWSADYNLDIAPATDGWLLGQPVDGPEAWVEVATSSAAFSRRIAEMFFARVMGRPSFACEQTQILALAGSLEDQGYQVERMLHELIDLDAYGAP